MTSPSPPRLLRCGDAALSVDFGDVIDPAVNARVLALDRALEAEPFDGLRETVPTYRSLLIHLDPLRTDFSALAAHILSICERPADAAAAVRQWRVPVAFGGEFGMDLDDLAARHGISAQALVAQYCAGTYVVAMIGFMPGFAYLSGLDPALATPRRLEPRQRVPSQSVAIGGSQTAVSTVEGPSGWHMIGRTPARGFMPGRDPVFTYAPGDVLRFEPIDGEAWTTLDALADTGAPVARLLS